MKLSSLQVNTTLAEQGVKFDFGQPDEDTGKQAWFRIGHAENSRTKLNKIMRAATAKLPMGKTLKDKVVEALNKEAMCGTVLIDFGGIDDDNGKPLPVNEANMLAILNTPACFAFIASKSVELANFQEKKEEEAKAETKSGAGLEPGMGGSHGLPDADAGRGDGSASPVPASDPA